LLIACTITAADCISISCIKGHHSFVKPDM
jgi:hypothetical protein